MQTARWTVGACLIGIGVASYLALDAERPLPRRPPAPTEGPGERGEGFSARRKAWIEHLHYAAPGVDWRAMDAAARAERIADRARRQASLRRAGVAPAAWAQVRLPNGFNGSWIERGSSAQSGRVVAAEFDPSTSRITALAHGGQLWRANRALLDWTSPNDTVMFRPNGNFGAMIRLGNPERLLVMGDQPPALAYSDNGGTSYIHANGATPANGWYGVGLAARDANGPEVYALRTYYDTGAASWRVKLFASGDRGATFSDRGFVGDQDQVAIFSPRDVSTTMYLLNGSQLSTITPGTHALVARGVVPSAGGSPVTLTGGRDAGTGQDYLYAFYARSATTDVYRSLDGGMTWTARTPLPTALFGNFSAEASPQFSGRVYAGGVNLYRSADGAGSWQLVNDWTEYYGNPAGKLHADIPNIDVFANGASDRILVSSDGGLYESTDHLLSVSNLSLSGLNVSQYYGTYTQRAGPRHILAGAQDQGLQKALSPTGGIQAFIQTYAGDYAHLGSGNGGASIWMVYPGFAMLETSPAAPDTTGLRFWNFADNDFEDWYFLAPLAANPSNGNRALLAGGRIGAGNSHHVVDLEYNGSAITHTLDPFDFATEVTAVAFSTDGNTRYAMNRSGAFFRSVGGGSWTPGAAGGLPPTHYFHGNDLIVHPTIAGTIYVAGSGYSNPGVYRSTNNGDSFNAFATGLPSTMIFDLAISGDGQHLFAATELGPYYYDRTSSAWIDIGGVAAPEQVYWDVDFVDSVQTARFSTYGRGIWDFVDSASTVLFRDGFES